MDRAPFESSKRIFNKARFIERVGMDCHLHIKPVRDSKAIVDRGRGRSPILMQFQTARTSKHHFLQCAWQGCIALAKHAEIHRHAVK